jgi:site-specific recombinase XerD
MLTFSQALEGFILHCAARHLSAHTIEMYQWILNKFADYLQTDKEVTAISITDIEGFLAAQDTISNTTLHHYHAALGSFYTWATTRNPPLVAAHLPQQIRAPKPDKVIIEPFTLDEVRALLKYAGRTRVYERPGKRPSYHKIRGAERNRALILLLLDTGMRASEVCALTISSVDMEHRRILLMGKGHKMRRVKFSARTGEALWRYLATRPDTRPGDALIATLRGAPLRGGQVYQILRRIGKRAEVANTYTHRFRHTFATEFLRNGGDPYTLQEILGHTSMEMVRRYVHTAQIDIDEQHRRASPVDNWRL